LWSAIFLSSKELDARVCEIATLRDVHEAELGVCEKHCPELAEARACLREALAAFGELCGGGAAYDRWRKAAGLGGLNGDDA
jgi:hypothetical protein